MDRTNAPLQVGVLLDSFTVPLWIRAVLEEILQSPIASIALIIRNAKADRPPDGSRDRNYHHALYHSYCRAENAYFNLRRDAYSHSDVSGLFDKCDVIDVAPTPSGEYDEFAKDSVQRIERYGLDLILKFGFRKLHGDILRVARFGVWEHVHSDTQTLTGGPPGFWEVFLEMPFTGAALKILGNTPDLDRTIDRCLGYTDKTSVRRNRSNNAWRSSRFVMRCLERLHKSGLNESAPCSNSDLYVPYRAHCYGLPDNFRMGVLLGKHLGRRLKTMLHDTFYLSQWAVAFKLVSQANEIAANMEGFSLLRPPRDRLWADPFVIMHQGRYFLFVEELFYSRPKGHISLLEFDGVGKIANTTIVLKENYHLSYPFLFRYHDQIYMMPETSQNRTIQIYQATHFPYKWELRTVLMKDVSAVDTTLVEGHSAWWMFTTMGADSAPNVDELYLFHADTPFGPWQPHPKNPIVADCRRGRQAGRVFSYRGQLYRPAQCSTKGGGYAITINRIVTLDTTDYREEPVDVILPEPYHHAEGLHTLNSDGGMTVIDLLLRRNRWSLRKAARA
jgi:hypothetical protein